MPQGSVLGPLLISILHILILWELFVYLFYLPYNQYTHKIQLLCYISHCMDDSTGTTQTSTLLTSSALHFHILNMSTVNTEELQNVDILQVGKILNLRGG